MNGLISIVLDVTLIALLAVAIHYAMNLSRQLAGLRASRADMERFVIEFSATVHRAEAGITGLKQAARSSGDDLERLIEKAQYLRDELHFLVESADQIANRLSDTAAAATRLAAPENEDPKAATVTPLKPDTKAADKRVNISSGTASAAERELLKILGKLG